MGDVDPILVVVKENGGAICFRKDNDIIQSHEDRI